MGVKSRRGFVTAGPRSAWLASEGRQGKNRPGATIAEGNEEEMDCPAIANGKLDKKVK